MSRLRKRFYVNDNVVKNFVELNSEDRETIRQWRNSDGIRQWMYNDKNISKGEHADFIERLKDDPANFYWLVESESGNNKLGVIYLNKVDPKHKSAYLGIYKNLSGQTKGAGSRLMECLKDLAFKKANLETLKLEVLESNKKAIAFYQKQGFKEEGRLKNYKCRDGKWQDALVMGMRREEIK